MLGRVYTKRLIEIFLSDIKFVERNSALKRKNEIAKDHIALCDAVPSGSAKPEAYFMRKMALDTKPPSLWQIFLGPLLISFNPSVSVSALMTPIDFTLSNAKRFYSSKGNPSDTEELTTPKTVPIKRGKSFKDMLERAKL